MSAKRPNLVATIVLIVGTVYCLFPLLWILIAATKSAAELFSTPTLLPSFNGGFFTNVRELFQYNNGVYGQWMANSALYAGVGGLLSTLISACAGYSLSKYKFPGSRTILKVIVAGVMLPAVLLAIPQYLMLARLHLTNSYISVILCVLVSPYAIYLCKIYADASVPDELMEAARIDGASESKIFTSIGIRLMTPALITVFLLQFIAIWNNFLLPYVMLSSDELFPLTMGLRQLLSNSASKAAQYSAVIVGVLFAIIPVAALFLALQRFWRLDLLSGGVKL